MTTVTFLKRKRKNKEWVSAMNAHRLPYYATDEFHKKMSDKRAAYKIINKYNKWRYIHGHNIQDNRFEEFYNTLTDEDKQYRRCERVCPVESVEDIDRFKERMIKANNHTVNTFNECPIGGGISIVNRYTGLTVFAFTWIHD